MKEAERRTLGDGRVLTWRHSGRRFLQDKLRSSSPFQPICRYTAAEPSQADQ